MTLIDSALRSAVNDPLLDIILKKKKKKKDFFIPQKQEMYETKPEDVVWDIYYVPGWHWKQQQTRPSPIWHQRRKRIWTWKLCHWGARFATVSAIFKSLNFTKPFIFPSVKWGNSPGLLAESRDISDTKVLCRLMKDQSNTDITF